VSHALLGEPLDDPVGLVALHAALDEREQDPLGEHGAVRQLEVAAHALGMDDHALRDRVAIACM
jgi:hypothetical protein